MYDEVSHGTPTLNALQLSITEFFQIPADITVAYWPSKTNTTAVQRTCKPICCNMLDTIVSCATIPSERSRQRHEIIRASMTRMARRSTRLLPRLHSRRPEAQWPGGKFCNDDESALLHCFIFSTPPTRPQSCMAVQRRTQSASTAQVPLSNCDVEPIPYRQCTGTGIVHDLNLHACQFPLMAAENRTGCLAEYSASWISLAGMSGNWLKLVQDSSGLEHRESPLLKKRLGLRRHQILHVDRRHAVGRAR
jgi:hypothetical protein